MFSTRKRCLIGLPIRGATTLNFGPISTKLGGIIPAIKKMTQKDNGPGPSRNYRETGVFTFGRKVVFGPKYPNFGVKKAHFRPWRPIGASPINVFNTKKVSH